MFTFTIMDVLYSVLIFFIIVVGTLLSIVLYKLIKILNPMLEMVGYYEQFKNIMSAYKSIPSIVKERILEFFRKENKK